MKALLQKIWRGIKYSVKWLVIQFAAILLYYLFEAFAFLIMAVAQGSQYSDVVRHYTRHSLYTTETGFLLFLPVSTF